MKIVGIYLAAGNSSRMGSNKLTLPVGTMTLGSLALKTALASSLDEVYIITKELDNTDWLPFEMGSNSKCKLLKCSTAHKGQSESLRHGIRQAQANSADAVIIMLADQPLITVQMIEEMILCIKNTPVHKFVATTFENTIMPPVLFTSSMYPELLKLRGDKGARMLLQGDFLHNGKLLPCTDQRFVFDVDTKDDYQTMKAYESNK